MVIDDPSGLDEDLVANVDPLLLGPKRAIVASSGVKLVVQNVHGNKRKSKGKKIVVAGIPPSGSSKSTS